jgi:hypothetical protein
MLNNLCSDRGEGPADAGGGGPPCGRPYSSVSSPYRIVGISYYSMWRRRRLLWHSHSEYITFNNESRARLMRSPVPHPGEQTSLLPIPDPGVVMSPCA